MLKAFICFAPILVWWAVQGPAVYRSKLHWEAVLVLNRTDPERQYERGINSKVTAGKLSQAIEEAQVAERLYDYHRRRFFVGFVILGLVSIIGIYLVDEVRRKTERNI